MPGEQMSPVDRDVDLHVPAERRRSRRSQVPVLAVIAAGGAAGACARYSLTVLLPQEPGAFPLATFATNATGCLLIGVLMVLAGEVWSAHRLLRPFLATGLLGGYTTFSAYTVEARTLLDTGHVGLGFGYLGATLAVALATVYLGIVLARWAVRVINRRRVR